MDWNPRAALTERTSLMLGKIDSYCRRVTWCWNWTRQVPRASPRILARKSRQAPGVTAPVRGPRSARDRPCIGNFPPGLLLSRQKCPTHLTFKNLPQPSWRLACFMRCVPWLSFAGTFARLLLPRACAVLLPALFRSLCSLLAARNDGPCACLTRQSLLILLVPVRMVPSAQLHVCMAEASELKQAPSGGSANIKLSPWGRSMCFARASPNRAAHPRSGSRWC